jgi:hypothetical protein
MSAKHEVQSFVDGEVSFWIEQESSIHLKAASSQGDPAELTAEDAREIAAALIAAAQKIDASSK